MSDELRPSFPGLVNAHSHAFQRAIRGRTERRTTAFLDNFWTWREAMYHAANSLSPEDIYDVSRMAFLEMLLSGITTVGEFHYLHNEPDGTRYGDANLIAKQVVQAARDTGIRIALLRTAYSRAGWNMPPNPEQRRFLMHSIDDLVEDTDALRQWAAQSFDASEVSIGLASHSIRALPLESIRKLVKYARAHSMKVHMHVAEQPAEIEACQAEHGQTPVQLLHREGLLGPEFTAIHATYATREEVNQLAAARASICACPTTERNLGDGIGRAHEWAESGVPVCFGSDSNVQIDLLEDARELEYHLRLSLLRRAVLGPDTDADNLARRLFEYATVRGAESLGMPGRRLESGLPADFFTVDLNDPQIAGASGDSVLSAIVFGAGRPAIRDVYVNGLTVVEDGMHFRQDEIVSRFQNVMRRVWG